MISAAKSIIRDGSKFDRLFPGAKDGHESITDSANLDDTITTMKKVAKDYAWQVRRVAAELQGRTLRETCRNVWEFCYGYFQYQEDEKGREQVRTPARAWADRHRGIDCDCFSTLISALMRHLRGYKEGVSHLLRVTKYPSKKKDGRDGRMCTSSLPKGVARSSWTRSTTGSTKKFLTWTNSTLI